MPAVAVIGGIATAAGAASGAAALIGGTITLSTVASGLAFVGGVASALGGITGNKKLMKFGMIAGVAGLAAGGINSLMNSGADAAANVAGAAGSGIMGPPTELAQMDSMGNLSLSDTSNALELSYVQPIRDAAAPQGMLGSASSGNILAETANAANAANAPAATQSGVTISDPAAANAGGGNFAPNTSSVMADEARKIRMPPVGGESSTGGSAFSNFGKWLNENKELVKTGTGILGGLGQGYMEQEKLKEAERIRSQDRARLNASIMGQRANY